MSHGTQNLHVPYSVLIA